MPDSLLDDPATDPALAAVIRDMYRRWPNLARDADHPLAEFFLRRRRRFDLREPLATIAAVTIFITGMTYIPTPFGPSIADLAKPFLLFFLARWIYRKLRTYGPSSRLDSPIDLMARLSQSGDRAERIAPISPFQMPAIHAAVELCRHRRLLNRVLCMTFFLLLAIPVVLAPLWYYLAHDLPATAIAPLAGLTALFGALAGSFLGEHRCVLRSLHGATTNSESGTEVGCITGFLFLTLAGGTIAFAMNHSFKLVDVRVLNYIPLLLAFLLFCSGISILADRRRHALRVDEHYRELLDRMQTEADHAE